MGDPYTGIQTVANWSNVATDGVFIAVALAACVVTFRGSRMLLAFIRGDGENISGFDPHGDPLGYEPGSAEEAWGWADDENDV